MKKDELLKLEERITAIEERNKRVELDKAWETCVLRKVLIIMMTYIFAVLYLTVADNSNSFFGAVVTCVGFFLSTKSINFINKVWSKKRG